MAPSKSDTKTWFDRAVALGATHLVVINAFDRGAYPVYCGSEQAARARVAETGEIQRVVEVYRIDLGWDAQSTERVHNF